MQSEIILAVISGILALGIILLTVRLCHYKKQLRNLYKNNNESASETINKVWIPLIIQHDVERLEITIQKAIHRF